MKKSDLQRFTLSAINAGLTERWNFLFEGDYETFAETECRLCDYYNDREVRRKCFIELDDGEKVYCPLVTLGHYCMSGGSVYLRAIYQIDQPQASDRAAEMIEILKGARAMVENWEIDNG